MTCDFIQLANPGVQKLKPYQPGKPIDELERELGIKDIVKLASNENPLGPGHKALHAAKAALQELHRYPDGSGFRLKSALAEQFGVQPNQITLGNGSNDVLELIARSWLAPGDEVIFSEHAFAVYPLVTLACSATPVQVPAVCFGHDLEAMAGAVTPRTRIIFVANPNNPTGTWFHRSALELFLAKVPEDVLVVLDEAYFEYVEEAYYPDGMSYLAKHANLIVTRTFSKIHGLAGLRIGYGVSSPEIADVLNRVRQPFNCNMVALAAAEASLQDSNYLEDSRSENTSGLGQLSEGFERLGLSTIPSVANFIAFDCQREAMPLYNALLKEGVIVRPIAAYGMPNYLRVSVGLARENERFLKALEKVLA
ncbi:MAG: histidinol-phosphate transaminase [Alcanivoracaceae bacterium]|nr:histidinol-phosphate transaminase [Alcanivoracaceae bacterium]